MGHPVLKPFSNSTVLAARITESATDYRYVHFSYHHPKSNSFSELHRKKFSADDADEPEPENEEVYGIVKTHAPPQAPQVRDPTKEILSGLWRSSSRSARPSSSSPKTGHHTPSGGKKHFQPYFGRIRTHSNPDSLSLHSKPISKFQLLKNELYGKSASSKSNQPETELYGTVHHRFNPNSAAPDKSRLDLVRSILAKEEGMEVNEESKNAFDRIRDKLLNTRNHHVRTSSKERNLRRKGSKKRRRNVSYIY